MAAEAAISHACRLSLDERFMLCRSIAEECTTDEELRNKLLHVPHPVAYDGFEPSGRMHIAQVLHFLQQPSRTG